jgi:2-polyprenyl-6-methoxyphenol hydroxylase-like FAD-dependent oxidoreductase
MTDDALGEKKRILITGGSIAGCSLAWWLSRGDFDVTVLERHATFRDGGQNIDVRGAAREVVRKMGLEEGVSASGTGEAGIRFVDERNETLAEFGVEDTGSEGPTAELEILRGDLARLLFDACSERVNFRFGDKITSIDDGEGSAAVSFESGGTETFDLVIVAEGAGSSTRELVFPGENEPRTLDVTMGYFTIPKGPSDTDFCRIYTAGEGRSIWLRPDNKGTTRAILTVQKAPSGEDELGVGEQKNFLRERFAGAGWETPRVLAGFEQADDFYFDVLRQVKMPRWSKGTVVLAGDAAWCATPISGMGTTLAIVGAYVLAGELVNGGDVSEALDRYEEIMRPFVEKAQDVPKSAPKFLQPQSRFGVALQHIVLRVADLALVKKSLSKVMGSQADDFELPNYEL